MKRLLGDELSSRVSQIWGVDEEGEQNCAWRYLGVPNLWFMTGACLHKRCFGPLFTILYRQPRDVPVPL